MFFWDTAYNYYKFDSVEMPVSHWRVWHIPCTCGWCNCRSWSRQSRRD